MSKLELDIENTIKILDSVFVSFNKYGRMYTYTNENLSGYYKKFKLDNKVLTVTASGDQAIHSIMCGAKEIDCFDINILTRYFQNLKLISLKKLSLNEFASFYDLEDKNFFAEELFNKFKYLLDEETYNYWNSLYQVDEFNNNKRSLFFNNDSRKVLLKRCDYLNDENYFSIRNRVDNVKISYIDSDLLSLNKKISDNYDSMFFSNIYDYLNDPYVNTFDDFKNFIKLIGNHLSNDGQIQCYYNWCSLQYFYRLKEPFSLIECPMYEDDLESAVVYKKTK